MVRRSAVRQRLAVWLAAFGVLAVLTDTGAAQQPPAASQPPGAPPSAPPVRAPGLPAVPLPDKPLILNTHSIPKVRLVVVARGLSHPWGVAFLPDGGIVVTERQGRVRLIRDGVLDPQPIAEIPAVFARGLAGLMDVALHPKFAENRLVYLSYTRAVTATTSTLALIRGRLEGKTLRDVQDVFVAEPWGATTIGSRMAFAPDGLLYLAVGGAFDSDARQAQAQNPNSYAGKMLRLRDDGTVPPDNPFVGKPGYRPEIYSLGHRNQMGLAFHPQTLAPWVTEHSVQGGDELNIIEPGKNYGWPVVSYGRQYTGQRVSERFWAEGMQEPRVLWVPSIAPSGLTFYTGDRFPQWKGNLFVGSLVIGRIPRTGHLERIELNERGEEQRREWLLTELRQRIRDVRQGPDGLLYVLTDDDDGALLRLEPVEP